LTFSLSSLLLFLVWLARVKPQPAAFQRLLSSFVLHSPSMLVLKITNASDVVAAKIGRLLGALTPDALDEKTVEDVLIKELIKNLSAEGLKGEVAAVRGLELQEHGLEVEEGLHVWRHQPGSNATAACWRSVPRRCSLSVMR